MKRMNKLLSIILILTLVLSSLGVFASFAEIGVETPETGESVPTSFSDLSFSKVDGCKTVITDIEGEQHEFSGILNTTGLEDKRSFNYISSYAVIKDGETILEVQIRDVTPEANSSTGGIIPKTGTGGQAVTYYSTTFYPVLDGKIHEAFLTGLKFDQFQTLQSFVINALMKNESLLLTNLTDDKFDFIDTEKHYPYNVDSSNDSDADLCWAGAASNVLHYTGWAAKAVGSDGNNLNLNSEDDVFDLFMNSFTDRGGDSIFGYDWFFDGFYFPQNKTGYENFSKVDSNVYPYETFRGFLPDYGSAGYRKAIEGVEINENELSGVTTAGLDEALRYLKMGYGVNVGIGFCHTYYDRNLHTSITDYNYRDSSHAVTLWGYVVDNSVDSSNPSHYKKIFITDSDTDKEESEAYSSRSVRPNKMQMVTLDYNENRSNKGYGPWWLKDYMDIYNYNNVYAELLDFGILAPYSIAEDFTTGTRDVFSNADLGIAASKLSKTEVEKIGSILRTDAFSCYEFSLDDVKNGIWFIAAVTANNASSTDERPLDFEYKLQLLKKEDGEYKQVGSDYTVGITSDKPWPVNSCIFKYIDMPAVNLVDKFGTSGSLSEGEYKLVATVTPTSGNEAYLNNNTLVTEFTIGAPCFDIALSNNKLYINLKVNDMHKAVLAGYDDTGKMYFSKYLSDASKLNCMSFSNAQNVTKVVLYPLNDTYGLGGNKVEKLKSTDWGNN